MKLITFITYSLCVILGAPTLSAFGKTALEARVLNSTTLGSPEYAVKQAITRYLSDDYTEKARRSIEAVKEWLRYIRFIYPTTKRPLQIEIIDQLTAADLRLTNDLTTIVYNAGAATKQAGTGWPKLSGHGKSLFKLAEELLSTH